MRSVPWQVRGIDPEAREAALEAAQSAGMPLGRWLTSVIRDHAAAEHRIAPVRREPYRRPDEGLATISERLDDLTRQLSRLEGERPAPSRPDGDEASNRIADAILRLNSRLDHVIADNRDTSSALEQRVSSVDRALASLSQERVRAGFVGGETAGVDQAVAEIAARQRALDGEFTAPPPAALQRPAFSPIHCRADAAVDSLRKDLAEIGRALSEAMPRRAVEALEGEVRALVSRLDSGRQSGAETPALAGLEQGLREVRDALRGLAPAESLVGFDQAVKSLDAKIDRIAVGREGPAGLQPLEAAIASLRDVMGRVASSDALAALANEVRGLADRVERGAPAPVGPDMLGMLDHRIGAIADAIEAVREHSQQAVQDGRGGGRDLDHLLKSLNDKLDRLQATRNEPGSRGEQLALGGLEERIAQLAEKLDAAQAPQAARGEPMSRGERLAIGGLEDRIAKLVEKLDASEGRLGHLEAIERGMAELLVHLESLRANAASAALRPGRTASMPPVDSAPPVAELSHDVAALRQAQAQVEQRTQDSLEVVHGTIETVVDRLATIESNIRQDGPVEPIAAAAASAPQSALPPGPTPAPVPSSRPTLGSAPAPAPRAAPPARGAVARPPIDPSLPPDHPLEPGSGPPRVRPPAPANAADRVAASEVPLRVARSVAEKDAQKSAPGGKGTVANADPKSNYLQAARRAAQYAAQNAQRGDPAATADPDKVGSKLAQRLKALFVGISVAVIIVVALRFAASYLQSAELTSPDRPLLAEQPPAAPLAVASAAPAPNADAPPLVIAPPVEPAAAPVNPAVLPDPAPHVALMPLPQLLPAPAAGVLGADQPRPPLLPAAPVAPPALPAPVASAENKDVTGSIGSRAQLPAVAAPVPPVVPVAPVEALPPSIGGKALITAAMAGEPAAAYEVATRFAEGRGVPQDFHQAAVWYERAARGGLAPALFRLGALYEKGNGVAKDLKEARRLYMAAADKGNANAMHNIGVLYAEGIDGKPDFKSAAEWFRKSAALGIADSQYNLAVLYARGIGVERNINEAYRWFALAAKRGDADAARKRDEVASRLDQAALAALRQKVDTWVAERPPENAATVPAPPGGWDQAEPAPAPKAKPSRRVHARPAAAPI